MKTFKIEIPKGYEIDKEKSTFETIVFKPIYRETEYIDLGLPSGTLWAIDNEDGYYSYQEAINTFGENNLPKLTDFAELYDYCTWKWDDKSKSMIVIGPNSNYITLPALGYRFGSSSELYGVGYHGHYWSVTPSSNNAYNLSFYSDNKVYPSNNYRRIYEFSIRKIKRK